MSGHQMRWLAIVEWLAMIKRVGPVVGQSDGECAGLIWGQRRTLPGTRAANEQQRTNGNG